MAERPGPELEIKVCNNPALPGGRFTVNGAPIPHELQGYDARKDRAPDRRLQKLRELEKQAPRQVLEKELQQIAREVQALERDLQPQERQFFENELQLLPKPKATSFDARDVGCGRTATVIENFRWPYSPP